MQQIRFVSPNPDRNLFFATLRQRIDSHFKEKNLSRHSNSQMVVKTIVLFAAYIIPFIAILTLAPSSPTAIALWVIMGFALAGIGMSVMHDANHGAYSASSRTNYWLGHSLNLLGGSVFNWKLQHNILHHTYTNVVNMDDDIDDKLIMRFSPHTKVKWYHRYQFIYAFLFYGILTLYWALLKDFVQFYKYKREGVNKESKSQNKNVLLKIIFVKLVYFGIFLFIPLVFIGLPAGTYIAGFLLMHFIAGVTLTVIFQLAHTVEDTTHPVPDEKGTIENAWAIHQMNTTVNFSRKNKFLCWYLGGLNFQVEHHLFPTICHVHYPVISKIVKITALEFNVPYLENETFSKAISSHIRILKHFGRKSSCNPSQEKPGS